jgi:hypothetical protein
MEVHKHPHHITHKKKWGEYFLEFFMLFLAVFLGFIAENIREHYVEKQRAKEYMESFYEDLKTDTARIVSFIDFDEDKIKGLGHLEGCYETIVNNSSDDACMLDIAKNTAINRPFIRTERTLKQLANAGGFRLLKKEDADSINSYEDAFNNFQDFQTTVYQEAQNNVRNTLNTLENFKANAQMFKALEGKLITVASFTKENVTAPLLFSTEKSTLNKYFNELQLYYRVNYNHKRMLLELKGQQMRLIEYFNKKYHFE